MNIICQIILCWYYKFLCCLQCFDTVGRQEGHLGGVASSRMVGVSASVNLPLHHEVQKFSSGTGSPEWSQKKGRKTFVVVVVQMSPL